MVKINDFVIFVGILAILFMGISQQSIFSAVGIQATSLTSPYKAGDTFSQTFILSNTDTKTLPETSDIFQTTLWTAYTIRDAGNNKLLEPAPVEIKTPLISGSTINVDVSYVLPASATTGKYIAFAVLFKVPMVYDSTTNTWIQGKEQVLSKQAVSFNVAGIKPPVSGNLFQNLIDLLSGIFRGIFGG